MRRNRDRHWFVWTPWGSYEASGMGLPAPYLYELGGRAFGYLIVENDEDWHGREPTGQRPNLQLVA
jgi:hypothetical protein